MCRNVKDNNNVECHKYSDSFYQTVGFGSQVKLKDSNYCFNSLSIRQWTKDLKHLISGNGLPKLQG